MLNVLLKVVRSPITHELIVLIVGIVAEECIRSAKLDQ